MENIMENLAKAISGQCDEFQHIKWVANHVNLYEAVGYGQEILEKMQRYGGNIYTYPEDAIATYQEFEQHLQKNPYRYLTSFQKETDDIYATGIDGYLIKVDGLVLPIGFLKASTASNETEFVIKNFMEECLNEIQKEEESYVRDMENALRRGREYTHSKRNSLGARYVDIYLGILLDVAFMFSIIFYVIACIKAEIGILMICLGLMIGIIMETLFLQKMVKAIKILKEIKRMSNQQQYLQQYYNEYMEMKEHYYTNQNILVCEAAGSLTPCREWSQCQNILQEVRDIEVEGNLKNLGKMSFQKHNTMLLFACVVYVLVSAFISVYPEYRQRENEEAARIEQEATLAAEEERKAEEEAKLQEQMEVFDGEGFIYGDSDTRLLTEEELYQLQDVEDYDFKTLLGFARNEIYARHGYEFNAEGIYYPHYMQYEWYRGMSRRIVNDTDLNEYEITNRNLIVSVERREGFRQ